MTSGPAVCYCPRTQLRSLSCWLILYFCWRDCATKWQKAVTAHLQSKQLLISTIAEHCVTQITAHCWITVGPLRRWTNSDPTMGCWWVVPQRVSRLPDSWHSSLGIRRGQTACHGTFTRCCFKSGQRRRRWGNIHTASGKCSAFAGDCATSHCHLLGGLARGVVRISPGFTLASLFSDTPYWGFIRGLGLIGMFTRSDPDVGRTHGFWIPADTGPRILESGTTWQLCRLRYSTVCWQGGFLSLQ